ncbi:cysteine desulfurase family protein [Bacteriovorax sp. Seq25_V]|uniref:cysteine desulfurase family protein n=1 Tax=Bacteriovorax sp. Seq25_V TaxID=1201288 RepID=UPI00038A1C2B|nr:aminotransferase class V-fold PLP-dependent enzyme [Bacteriovorax sp. Seq25_V]EQC45468.1 aminotransferase, class V [Bacteriovorax sp. Seq25_V]
MFYFDHAASTPINAEAYEILCKSLQEDFANPASKHKLGVDLSKKINGAREEILATLKLRDSNLIFTSSATESNNQVIKNFSKRGKVIFYETDHPSVTNSVEESAIGLKLSDDIIEQLDESVSLVVLTLVNPQSGLIVDIETIAKKVKAFNSNIAVLIDAAQAIGKIPFDFSKDPKLYDYITIAGHKLGGPRGIACLVYKKEDKKLKPLLFGGGHEEGLRSSTPSTALILSLARAVTLAIRDIEDNYARITLLAKKLEEGLEVVHPNISLPFKEVVTSPYIISVLFKGIPSDVLLRHLEMKKVYVSSTTACSSKIKGFNPMLAALGIEEKYHKNILRVSLGHSTTEQDVDGFLSAFNQVINEIKFLIKK